MANPPSLIMGFGEARSFFNSTETAWYPITGVFNSDNNGLALGEAATKLPSQAGTYSKLWVRCIEFKGVTDTVNFRVNGVTVNQTISLSGTGTFSDITNNDTVNSGDLVDVQIAGTANDTFSIIAVTFVATTAGNTVSKLATFVPGTENGGTFFINPSGYTTDGNGTESVTKSRQRKAMTVKNFSVYILTGLGSQTATYTSRKNGAAGNLTVSAASNASPQLLQDITHSDSLALGDDYNYEVVVNAGGLATYTVFGADFISSNGDCLFSAGGAATTSNTFSTAVTNYYGLAGSLDPGDGDTTETNAQVTVNNNFLFSQLTCDVIANTISVASTVNLRAGKANKISLSIQASTNGIVNDNTDTYQASSTDAMNYQIITGSTGTSIQISFINVWGNATAATPAGGSTYQHFDNTNYARQNRQLYNPFGGQMIVFG